MSPTDWVIVVALAFSTIASLVRGLVVEVFSLAGLVVGVFVAGWQYDNFAPVLMQIGLDRNVADAVAFLLIAFGVAILVSLLGRLVRGVVRGVGLGWVDRLLGAVFGFLRGAAVVLIAAMALTAFFPGSLWVRDSKLLPYFLQASKPVEQWFPAILRNKLMVGRIWNDRARRAAR